MKNKPFKEPLLFSVLYIFSQLKFLKPLFLVMIFLAPIFMIISLRDKFVSSAPIDPTISAFIGVILGSLLSGVISYAIKRNEQKTEGLIRKNNEIYKKLYNGILQFENKLKEVELPRYSIKIRPSECTHFSYACFTTWTEIKRDYHYIEVPTWIKNALDEFQSYLMKYEEKFSTALNSVEDYLNGKYDSQKWVKNKEWHVNIVYIFESIINQDFDQYDDLVLQFVYDHNIDDEQLTRQKEFWQEISNEILQLENVKLFLEHWDKINLRTQWIKKRLVKIIDYINKEFENQQKIL
ncbi:MAG: hypothetical protein SVT56_11985 [Chloroflexota bacterium]|nr:hypothetical protein [Chloroflexota bacterium]